MNEQNYANQMKAEYSDKVHTKTDDLKALDRKVKTPANVFAYTFGVIGALVLGVGMCLAMKVLGDMMILGIVVGVAGIAMVSANYFIYKAILNSRKAKYRNEILTLSNSILNA